MVQKILVATTNPGKVAELRTMLDMNIDLLSLDDFENIEEVVEDGSSFEENSQKKALGYAKATGQWTIADDSGLVIDALDGQPGVHSARFSGAKDKDRSLLDHKNMAKVLKLMQGVPKHERTARFVCNITLANPEKVVLKCSGKLEGLITEREIGDNGFGYDPVFFVPKLKKTVAQLTAEEKNKISHRGNAIRQFKTFLKDLL